MKANPDALGHLRRAIQAFDFQKLFIAELGWDKFHGSLTVRVDGEDYRLQGVAQKRGLGVYRLELDDIPPAALRGKIETQVSRSHRENLIIFTDTAHTRQVWLWALRELGRPLARRSVEYHAGHSGQALAQRLQHIAFSLEEEGSVDLVEVVGRVRAAFNVERATKKFYDQFRKERDAFEKFVSGIPVDDMSRWYVSVMLNRLMFVYFIQKKGFLDGDPDYLRNRLRTMQSAYGEDQFDRFYRYFLLRLFHEGLGRPDHDAELEKLIGRVPYLNGGIFQLHEVEAQYPDIQIPDAAFQRVFDFFDGYQWHLDDRPLRNDNEINPDVLGYIFEKYINQKQMGAYYTKEDITEYISKNTIIPFLFDRAKEGCAVAFMGESSVWSLAAADPDRYIYAAVRQGTELRLPDDIAAGQDNVAARGPWNTPTPDEYALPTEIWRETVARRQRYEEVKGKLARGEIRSINDFITYNLDIRQFAQDVVEQAEGPDLLAAFWQALTGISVLDPTCGSGAFLFAALNILEPLYEAAIQRMREFTAEEEWRRLHPRYAERFDKVLDDIERHPNESYYIQKSIIVNNLYGVDIMAEAVEIAKLRLFLKLAAQVESVAAVEPLPDIDFNIRAGNTLVGYVKREEVREALAAQRVGEGVTQGRLIFGEDEAELQAIEEKAADIDRLYAQFRAMQTDGDGRAFPAADLATTKATLQRRLDALNDELDRALARQYGVDPDQPAAFRKWRESHQPFHWFTEFYGILRGGGFDAIIGNPPYVEYYKIRDQYQLPAGVYLCEDATNLFAFVIERSIQMLLSVGRQGLIVPISLICTQRMKTLQARLLGSGSTWHSNYAERPSKLFTGAEVLLSISLLDKGSADRPEHQITGLRKWNASYRPYLFESTAYSVFSTDTLTHFLPKISESTELGIVEKVWRGSKRLEHSLRDKGDHRIYYRIGGGRYWKIFTSFQPKFILNGVHTISSRENYLYFESLESRDIAIAVLSSSIFFWFFVLTTNGRDLNPSDLKSFPADPAEMSPELRANLSSLSHELMLNYQENRQEKQKTSRRTGEITYEEFYPRLAKSTIDSIDIALASHYGLSDEEVDYIINYDIKYRMGDELTSEDEED